MIRSGLKASHAASTVASIASVVTRAPKNSPSRSRVALTYAGPAPRVVQSSFDFVGVGWLVARGKCSTPRSFDLFGETRRHDHEDLVAAVAGGVDEGHQGVEVPGEAGGTEEESHRFAILCQPRRRARER